MTELNEYYQILTSEVLDRMNEYDNHEHNGTSLVDVVNRKLESEHFINSAPISLFCATKKGEIHGYSIDATENRLDIFFGIFSSEHDEPIFISKTVIDKTYNKMINFLEDVRNSNHIVFDEFSESSEAIEVIREMTKSNPSPQIRLFLYTNFKSRLEVLDQNTNFANSGITFELWDINRINNLEKSGMELEPINLNPSKYDYKLKCIPIQSNKELFKAYLTSIPGKLLSEMYKEYGQRLLESNVRSYLQNKTKTNRGIRDTILDEPEKFAAYNNGITIVAQNISISDDSLYINKIENFQIVNGGQTTASLYEAYLNKADLTEIFVMAKVIQLFGDSEINQQNIKTITKFANSQNNVKFSDYSANDKFFIELEKYSRTTYVNPRLSRQRSTKWFFERARGQYNELLSRYRTSPQRRNFLSEYPKSAAGENISQLIKKEDIAKFILTWEQEPHIVAMGATKVFNHFINNSDTNPCNIVHMNPKSIPTLDYYKLLISKALLFRLTEKIITKKHTSKDRAPKVAYTLSFLSLYTKKKLDLMKIYNEQNIDDETTNLIENISSFVSTYFSELSDDRTINEWAKREITWKNLIDKIEDFNYSGNIHIVDNLINDEELISNNADADLCKSVDSDTWKAIASWGKETKLLNGIQRGMAFTMGRMLSQGKYSDKMTEYCIEILKIAEENGFIDLEFND